MSRVVVTPSDVVVCPGTSRLLARQWIVMDVGSRAAPAWDVVLLAGMDGDVHCWTASRHLTRKDAEAAAADYAAGRSWPSPLARVKGPARTGERAATPEPTPTLFGATP